MPQRNIEIPTEALADYCKRNHILKLSLFGSVLRDDFHAGSDIDMLVEFDPATRINYVDLGRMTDELTCLMNRPVDLRTKMELSPCFRDRVLLESESVYVR
jgi:predicted nucleotidyltransferase